MGSKQKEQWIRRNSFSLTQSVFHLNPITKDGPRALAGFKDAPLDGNFGVEDKTKKKAKKKTNKKKQISFITNKILIISLLWRNYYHRIKLIELILTPASEATK